MGLFDFLKRHKGEHKEAHDGITYRAPDPISNEEYQNLRNQEAQYWEQKYDLSTVRGINSIPAPNRKEDSCGTGSITGQIEYYLMHKAGQYENEGKVDLALACYRKANELMPMSAVSSYPRDTYMRLPRYLRKLRRFEEAEAEEKKIDMLFGGNYRFIEDRDWVKRRNDDLFRDMKQFRTDLVEASYIRCCCAECAKYRERVYSLSGKDRRFPKLPNYLLDGSHRCGIQLYPFIDGVNSMHTRDGKDLDGREVIKYSNRPFVDDRTPDELADIEEIKQRQVTDLQKEKNRADYDWIWQFLPELCPKSLSGYVRMKNSNSKNYQKIVSEAKKLGKNIE